jgi:hypothetical protein
MGFEPTTPTLARLCSTPELRPRSPAASAGKARVLGQMPDRLQASAQTRRSARAAYPGQTGGNLAVPERRRVSWRSLLASAHNQNIYDLKSG